MKAYKLVIVLLVLFCGCKSELEQAKEERAKQKAIKSEHVTESYLFKSFVIDAYKDGASIGECNYSIKMVQTVIGKDSLWVIATVTDLIASREGINIYATPSVLKYIKHDDGYDIELELEAQVAENNSQMKIIEGDVISFLKTYDALRDNTSNVPEIQTMTFKDNGITCTEGNHIRLKGKIYITQQGNKMNFKKEALNIIPSEGFDDAKRYEFLVFDEFPEVITFKKSRGNTPIYESYKGANGEQIERVSKYDSTGVFDGIKQ